MEGHVGDKAVDDVYLCGSTIFSSSKGCQIATEQPKHTQTVYFEEEIEIIHASHSIGQSDVRDGDHGRTADVGASTDDGGQEEEGVAALKNPLLARRHKTEWQLQWPRFCHICRKLFPTVWRRQDHQRKQHGEEMKRRSTFDCIFCPAKVFGRSRASWVLMLTNHIYGYHPDAATTRVGEFKCLYCTETFFEASCRLRHIDELHSEQKASRICPVCEESFTIPQQLYAHVDLKHPHVLKRQRTLACPLCAHMAFDTKGLRGHFDICHSNREDYGEISCSLCGEEFNHPSAMWHHKRDRHRKAGSADWDIKCDCCEFTTDSSPGLLVHLQKKHGILTGSVPCMVQGCDSFFRKTSSRDRHVRISHPEHSADVQQLTPEVVSIM